MLSNFVIPRPEIKKENTINAMIRKNGISKSAIRISNDKGEIDELTPIGTRTSKMVLPIIVPPVIPPEPLRTPPIDTAISGKLVPSPTMKIPMIDCGI